METYPLPSCRIRRQLEHRSAVAGNVAAPAGGAVEVALRVENYTRVGLPTILRTLEIIECALFPRAMRLGHQLEDGATKNASSVGVGNTVEIPGPVDDGIPLWIASVRASLEGMDNGFFPSAVRRGHQLENGAWI